MAKKLIVGNWKMNFNPAEASMLVHRLDEKIDPGNDVTVVFCPPFIDLYPVSKEINNKKFKLGAQNIHYLDNGPFTGEISPAMLKGLVDFAIIGHSERRIQAGEDDKQISKKVAATVRHRITPILCVGDTADDHKDGHTKKVVNDQLTADLSLLTAQEASQVVIAYEPVWAISSGDGRGTFAKPAEITPVIASIRSTLDTLYGQGVGASARVLYGGSVNPDNAKTYLTLEGIDGLLVGGASLNYEEFAQIVKLAQG